MKYVNFLWVLFLLIKLSNSFASDFNHFTITPKFQSLTQKSDSQNIYTQEKQLATLNELLLPEELKEYNQNSFQQIQEANDLNWDTLLKLLLPFLVGQGKDLTQKALNDALKWNKEFGGKIKNFSNFQWQQPLGYITVNANRDFKEVGPQKIEVNDTLEFTIDATSLLKHLENQNLINITNQQLEAFAEIKYHKVFNYKHYKKSLEEAQLADISTLLFPFQFLHFPDFLKIKPEEEIANNDYLSFKLKASASANFFTWVKAGASIEGSLEQQHGTIIKVGKDLFYNDIYQMKKITGTLAKLDIEASVALDLFKLIDLTLIKLSFNYSLDKVKTEYYQAPAYKMLSNINGVADLWQASATQELQNTFNLSSYQTGLEKSVANTLGKEGKFLIWGSSSSTEKKIEQIKTRTKEFVLNKQSWSKETHVHSLIGGLLSSFIGDILSSFLGVSKKFSDGQEYSFYENTDEHEFQLELSRTMYLDNRNSMWSWGKSKIIGAAINTHRLIPSNVKKLWNDKWFQKNVLILDKYTFSKNLLSYFSTLNNRDFAISSIYLCNLSKDKAIDLNSQTNLIRWEDLSWKNKSCLKGSYDKLKLALSTSDRVSRAKHILDFLKYYFKHSYDSQALYTLFPEDILSHDAFLMGKNRTKTPFKGSYNRSNNNSSLNLKDYYLSVNNLWR